MIPRRIDPSVGISALADTPGEYETKYVFHGARRHAVCRWLEASLTPHPHFPSSIVSSVYFDTRGWRSLGEKLNSDLFKLKVRLRWYSNLGAVHPQDTVYLEAKFKRGTRRGKLRIPLELSARTLSQSDPEPARMPAVESLLRARGVDLPGRLIPVFRIDYVRLRFLEPMSRENLCLDYDIHVPRVNRGTVPRHDPRCLPLGVFEHKGRSAELPRSLRSLGRLGCKRQSFSKYLACYERLASPNG